MICKEFGLKYEDFIAECGELPKAFYGKITNPYALREIALEKPLSSNELARVILHIAKHRGYGNKHTRNISKDDAENKEKGKILSAIKINEEKIKNLKCATAGVYLNWVLKEKRTVRNSNGNYSQTIPQELNKEELELIFKKQAEFGVKFSEKFAKKVVEIAFFQRPLKSFDEMVGECVFLEGEKRAAKNTPSAIKFIALSRIVNILENISKRTGEYYNKKDIIDEVLNIVLHKGSISFSALRKILNLPESIKFNDSKLEYSKDTDKNGKSKNIETANFIEFKNLKKFNEILGNNNFNQDELDKIATEMTLIKDKEILQEKLKSFSLNDEQIEKLLDMDFSGFINLSLKALKKILPFMENG